MTGTGLPERCPVCGAPTKLYAVRDGSKIVCRRCGYVFEETVMDTGPEWRAYSSEEKSARSRVGAPLTSMVHDRGLATEISVKKGDLRSLKLAALQHWVRVEANRKLIEILSEVNSVVRRLNLPQRVGETAARILRKLYNEGLVKRSNASEYIAAALFAAARIERYTITMRALAEALDIDIQRAWYAYRKILSKFSVRVRPPGPEMYVSQIASKLGLSSQAESLALTFTRLLTRTGLSQGKPPETMAAAAVYLASILMDEKKNQSEVARTVGVSDATIRNRYRDIVDNFYIEVLL